MQWKRALLRLHFLKKILGHIFLIKFRGAMFQMQLLHRISLVHYCLDEIFCSYLSILLCIDKFENL